jgi:hypothetical protein
MEPVGPNQCEKRWRAVLASFDKQHKTLTANNPNATEEMNVIRTRLVKIGRLIETSPQQNGNGAAWKRLVDKAENEKSVLHWNAATICIITQRDGGQSPAGVCSRK